MPGLSPDVLWLGAKRTSIFQNIRPGRLWLRPAGPSCDVRSGKRQRSG